jgi:cyclomaltodextrinase
MVCIEMRLILQNWYKDSFIYHIYPLGLCGAPFNNRDESKKVQRLEQFFGQIDYWKNMGINTIYFGPVFESVSHGYDTTDYSRIDRRLGDNTMFAELADKLNNAGIRIILDGVFNHVGREFFAFQDVQAKKENSRYCSWFYLDFSNRSAYGDPFSYEGWEGHYNLVKLNLKNPEVKDYLFKVVRKWLKEFKISGLRLDVAYALDHDFIRELKAVCLEQSPDFWLMGEFIHGDYSELLTPEKLDSATNYECYKGLYSSHNDRNYFEIAYSLNRLFGKEGIYKNQYLYNFVDNHDVERIGSILKNKIHLFPLHILLMTIPGIPSVYYGSEFAIEGKKQHGDDSGIRPAFTNQEMQLRIKDSSLFRNIRKLGQIRNSHSTLRHGDYHQVSINHEQVAFSRSAKNEYYLVIVNMADETADVPLHELKHYGVFEDLLNPGDSFNLSENNKNIPVYSNWGRILRLVV